MTNTVGTAGTAGMAAAGGAGGARTGNGRVVRWDADDGSGAVVVPGEAAEVSVTAAAVEAPGGRGLQVGEMVQVTYADAGHGLVATRACPTDSEE